MEIYIPTPAKVLSQRKLEAYHTYSRIINEGRRNPIWFDEEMLGIKWKAGYDHMCCGSCVVVLAKQWKLRCTLVQG